MPVIHHKSYVAIPSILYCIPTKLPPVIWHIVIRDNHFKFPMDVTHGGSSSNWQVASACILTQEATCLASKSASYPEVLTAPLSPFATPASLAPAYPFIPGFHTLLPQQFITSAPCSLAGSLPPALGSRPPDLFTPDHPPSPKTSSWSAPSSPQISSTPSHTRSYIALPSLALKSAWLSQWPTVPLLTQKMCSGSLALWEPGDLAATYPFNLHSRNQKDSVKLLWTVAVGERPGSLRLCSNCCNGACDPSQSCCLSSRTIFGLLFPYVSTSFGPFYSLKPTLLVSFHTSHFMTRHLAIQGDWKAQDGYLKGYLPSTPSLPPDAQPLGTQHRRTT